MPELPANWDPRTVALNRDPKNSFLLRPGQLVVDVAAVEPMLGALADNGGPTPTFLPMAGSPIIDVANAAMCPPTDQRGVPRPQGVGCDVGAVEVESP